MSYKNRNLYPFQRGLATGQRLEIFAGDPTLAVLANEGLLPGYGNKTRRARVDAVGMLVFGAATVLFDSDRRAEAELGYQWPLLRPVLERFGASVGPTPPTANSWRYYRKRYLTWEVLAELKDAFRDLEAGRAMEMGLFPTPSEPHDYLVPDHLHSAYADGTWFLPASETGIRGQKSRATVGAPKLARDLDVRGNAVGYCHVFLVARRSEERMRLVLDFERARNGEEIPVVLGSVARLRTRVGDGFRHFIYDRALSAHDHVRFLVERGILPITKPAGVDSFSDWQESRGKVWKPGVPRFDLALHGCVHRMALHQGMIWHLEPTRAGFVYAKVAEHLSIDRYENPDGSFGFTIGLRMRCGSRWHPFSVDLTKPNPVVGGTQTMGINLKPHPVSDIDAIAGAYSIRSDVESTFSRFKNHLGMGPRAGSLDPRSHEVDLLLLSLVNNALAYSEWCQRYAGGRLAA